VKITDISWIDNQYRPVLSFLLDGKRVLADLDQKKTLVDLNIFSVYAPDIELPTIHLPANENMGEQDLVGFLQSETVGKLLLDMANAVLDGEFSERKIDGDFEL
jgi:hypothetical protein